MARFARECLAQMSKWTIYQTLDQRQIYMHILHSQQLFADILVKKLEVNLGPDTGDLGLRIGLHSGAVTAGVLRGERSRFQLFGDTMSK